MQVTNDPTQDIVRYLLGELPERDRRGFEERYFADDALFESVCAVEDELIASYLRGELRFWKRRKFRREYLADPRRRRRLEFVANLLDVSRRPSLTPERFRGTISSWPKAFPVLAALVLVTCVGWAWAVFRERQAENETAQLRTAVPTRLNQVFSIVLAPGQLRGSRGPQPWRIPRGTEQVRVQLKIPAGGPERGYRARIQTPDGDEVWFSSGLFARFANGVMVVTLELPAAAVAGGDYVVRLDGPSQSGGFESLEDFAFSVARQ